MSLVRIAAVGDVHVQEANGVFRNLVREVCGCADVLVLAGDLTHRGLAVEAEALARELADCSIPVVAVLGNHDYEASEEEAIARVLLDAGVHVLDGTCFEYQGVGFAGVKGFGGGFDNRMLLAWGERLVKEFVYESMDQAARLEQALMAMKATKKVVLMHYAPIYQTVEGEPKEIYTYLGCSRLCEPIDRQNVCVVFHGHAHHGTHAGRTSRGIPVFNVAMPVMKKLHADRPFHLFEVEVEEAEPTNGASPSKRRARPEAAVESA